MNYRHLIVLGLAISLSGPALAADEAENEEATEDAIADEKVCLNPGQVRNFDALTDEHVFVEESGREYYLLTLKHRCFGLKHANAIAFKDTMSRICSNGFSDIVHRDMGRSFQSCRIGTIEPVENKEAAEALIAEREE